MTKTLLVALLTFCAFFQTCFAATEKNKGLDISIQADNQFSGWQSFSADISMALIRNGETYNRDFRIYSMEQNNDGDKTKTIFQAPKDIKGTALLIYSHKHDPDEQWTYLPVLKRIKRISSKNKSGPFVGSDFAIEDMASQEIEKYTYKFLREELCFEDSQCYLVERTPVDINSGYSKQVAWIEHSSFRIFKVEFYDRDELLLKTLQNSQFKLHEGKYWRPHLSKMTNVQTGDSTQLSWSNFNFSINLSKSHFNKNSLKRAR